LGLIDKALFLSWLPQILRMEELDGYLLAGDLMLGEVDSAHPPTTDLSLNLVTFKELPLF